jgi:hypothetical protein
MSVDMIVPAWMHSQITAADYESWSEERCAGIEIVDGMVVVSPSTSKRHSRLARILANALDAAAGPDWNADTDFDVRLQDVPLTKPPSRCRRLPGRYHRYDTHPAGTRPAGRGDRLTRLGDD